MIDQLRGEIEALRAQTRPLEPDSDQRRALGGQALDHALSFLDGLEDAPSLRPATEAFSQRLDPEFPEDGRDPIQLVEMADSALYRAKRNGRNQVCAYRPPPTTEVVRLRPRGKTT